MDESIDKRVERGFLLSWLDLNFVASGVLLPSSLLAEVHAYSCV